MLKYLRKKTFSLQTKIHHEKQSTYPVYQNSFLFGKLQDLPTAFYIIKTPLEFSIYFSTVVKLFYLWRICKLLLLVIKWVSMHVFEYLSILFTFWELYIVLSLWILSNNVILKQYFPCFYCFSIETLHHWTFLRKTTCLLYYGTM